MTHSNDAIYHMLAKVLKFSTTKMQCTNRQSRGLSWVVMWAKVGKEVGKYFGIVELKAIKIMEQANTLPKRQK